MKENQKIEKCCICGGGVEHIYEIPFRHLLGLTEIYEEKIGYCEKCGFLFNANPFSESQWEERYKNLSKFEYNSSKIFEPDIAYKKRTMRQHEFIFRNDNCIQSVFEVGASTGYNLGLLQKKGLEVFGIEPSIVNKEVAKRQYNVELYADTYQNYCKEKDNNKKYDLIYLSHTLEHIVNPFSFVRSLSEINNDMIFIEVPTFDFKLIDEPYGMFGEEHVNYFTYQSLYSIMSKLGYQLVDAQMEFSLNSYFPAGFPSILTLWKKCEGSLKQIYKKPVCDTRTLFELYISKSEEMENRNKKIIDGIQKETKLAIWGTGHHTSRLLATSKLSEKNIVKFYDSDIRKHSYKIMDIEITSFNRKDVDDGKIEAILISSYVAQDSIESIIMESNVQCEIIKLYDI